MSSEKRASGEASELSAKSLTCFILRFLTGPHIALYHGSAALLTESMEVIQKTSAVLLAALEDPAAEGTAEVETEPEIALAKAS